MPKAYLIGEIDVHDPERYAEYAAQTFYHSEAYQAVVPIRQAVSSSRFFIVEGTD